MERTGVRWLLGGAAQAAGVSLAGVVAVLVVVGLSSSFDPARQMWTDGFGRPLLPGGGVLGREMTPGLGWELIDLAVVAPLVLGAIGLFRWGRRARRIEA